MLGSKLPPNIMDVRRARRFHERHPKTYLTVFFCHAVHLRESDNFFAPVPPTPAFAQLVEDQMEQKKRKGLVDGQVLHASEKPLSSWDLTTSRLMVQRVQMRSSLTSSYHFNKDTSCLPSWQWLAPVKYQSKRHSLFRLVLNVRHNPVLVAAYLPLWVSWFRKMGPSLSVC